MRRPVTVAALAALAVFIAGPLRAGSDAAAALRALLDEAWEYQLSQSPTMATWAGDHRYDDRLPDVSPEAQDRRAEWWRAFLGRFDGIDREALSRQDRISFDMFRIEVLEHLEEHRFQTSRMPVNSEVGFHTGLAYMVSSMPFENVRDYENYISRLEAVPAYFDAHVVWMRQGLADGFVQPRVVLDGFETTISVHIVEDVETSVFYEPFTRLPATLPEPERHRLREAGERAIRDSVVPAHVRFLEFFTAEYLPGARESIGASELPDGRAYYEHLVKSFTTLDVTPEQVHEIGLAEVARIRKEMEAVIEEVEFEGSFAAFVEFLRTDPRFYPKTPEQLLKEAAWIAKRMDGRLPALFHTTSLPRQPYTVARVPDHLAPRYTAGRYSGASIASRRAGTYWVNVHALESRPLYALEALTLHEAVPGHHLQNALRQELEDLPMFRQHSGLHAYGEGWALYSERLGLEAGFYTDPYSNFGRLTYEMWRACRLVVDTGMHALGWTRQQARDFLSDNTALSLHEIRTEVDRYISWPGQALAYKMGELKIRELRERAQDRLGADFDVRDFHDVVLGSGPVPLSVLEALVDEWLEEAAR
jgi:uncharacterized protein (DUF885 family)